MSNTYSPLNVTVNHGKNSLTNIFLNKNLPSFEQTSEHTTVTFISVFL